MGEGRGTKPLAIGETKKEIGMADTKGGKREAEDGFKTPPAAQLAKTVKLQSSCADALITPLMFSPASSVASLDSFDHDGSLQDGYSSYEEASHATSGRVSPFDLPDSPSQSMPTAPLPPPGGSCVLLKPGKNPSAHPLAHQNSVYADVTRRYHEEGTPMAFSTCVSLSGLALDEEKVRPDYSGSAELSNAAMSEDSETLLGQLIASAMPGSRSLLRSHLPKPPQVWPPPVNGKTTVQSKADCKVNLNASDDSSCSQEQQDLLAECIASAMPVPATRLRSGRQATEGAPAPGLSKQGKKTMSHQRLPSSVPSTLTERRGSHLEYGTEDGSEDEGEEDKKVQMGGSKLSSASSLGSFKSQLPRPFTVGRSGSSGSSPGAPETVGRAKGGETFEPKVSKSFNSSLSDLSIESLDMDNNGGKEEEDLLAACISSAIPKSNQPRPNK